MDFDRETIVAALKEVGAILIDRKKIGDIIIFGGAALLLEFDLPFMTNDVDVRIDDGMHSEIQAAVLAVAKRHGWPSTWLNEGVRMYLSDAPEKHAALFGEYPNPERVGLRVYTAHPRYILTLKLRALRTKTRDIDDIVMLSKHLGIENAADLLLLANENFPNDPIDDRKRALISSLGPRLI